MRHVKALFLIMSFTPLGASANCWEQAGLEYGIDPLLLKAIAWKESRGRIDALSPQRSDGNQDIGLMQINSIHLPTLQRFGISRDDLLDACVSQRVGAWILADCIQHFGATWKAVGCYNTGPSSNNVDAQRAYVLDVQRYYRGYRQQQEQLITATMPVARSERE